MNLDQLANGSKIFVDSNILIYHFTNDSKFGVECSRFIARIQNDELLAVTSFTVLSEISHRLMAIEAYTNFQWPYQGIVKRLRSNPDTVAKLEWTKNAFAGLKTLKLELVPGDTRLMDRALQLSNQFGVLTNDACILAAMSIAGTTNLATTDADFDRIPGITRYSP